MTEINSKEKAYLVGDAALDKKADRVVVMEMNKVLPICDYFVIASGESRRKVKAIADNIQEVLSSLDIKHWHVEGFREGQWVLLDYNNVVAHIFLNELRSFYDLEHLWGDAPRFSVLPAHPSFHRDKKDEDI